MPNEGGAPERSPQPIGILLVDDRVENLVALEGILRSDDYRLVRAMSGAEALKLVLKEDFAVILLDVVMPEMSGFEVADHLEQLERTRRIPIIFLTGLATDAREIYRAYSVGAVDYLIKPLEPDVVRKKVAVFADLYRQRREIEEQARRLRESERREYEIREAELRIASDVRYRKLVQGIDHAIAWTMDPRTRGLSFVSRQAEAILGYSARELGEPGFWEDHIPDAGRSLARANLDALLQTGEDKSWSHGFVAADGRELWFQTSASVEGDISRRETEIHGISVDVTELKRAEHAQRLMVDAADLLVEELDDRQGMTKLAKLVVPALADLCVIDRFSEGGLHAHAWQHVETDCESVVRALIGRSPLDPEGPGPIAEVFRTGEPQIRSEVRDAGELSEALGIPDAEVFGAMEVSSYMVVPLAGRRRSLGVMTLLSTRSRRRFGSTDLVLAVELARRASLMIENTLLYVEARDASRARAEIMAVVSHDLRSPLSAIRVSASLLSRLEELPQEERGALSKPVATICRAASRMQRLIDDLLDIDRIERKTLPIDKRAHTTESLVLDGLELLTPLAEQKRVKLEAELAAVEGLEVSCDRDRVLQVFSNLVENAIKFSPADSSVTVRADRRESSIVFVVEDHGPGIAAEDLPHIFERNWQASASGGGTGLGLAIAKGIVEAHEGRMWVDSEVGRGSAFFFELPRAPT